MKIIDEKGRLFGKINVIDFLAIVFLLSLMPAFYFGYKIFMKKPKVEVEAVKPKKSFVELKLVFDLVRVSPDTLKLISVGDKEIDADGQVIGEIIDIKETGPYVQAFDIGDNLKLFKEDLKLRHVLATMKIKAELKENKLYYKDKQIIKNSPIDFKTDKYQIEAEYFPQSSPAIRDVSLSIDARIRGIEEQIEALREEIAFLRILEKKMMELNPALIEKKKWENHPQ